MDFVIEGQLTNTRPEKSSAAELTVSCTAGNLKLTEAGAGLLGVVPGDYLGVIVAKVNGESKVMIHKGWKDGKKNVGSKLASPTKKIAGALMCSSTNAYKKLQGSPEFNTVYSIGEGVENNGVTFFPLTFARKEEKTERVSKAEATA